MDRLYNENFNHIGHIWPMFWVSGNNHVCRWLDSCWIHDIIWQGKKIFGTRWHGRISRSRYIWRRRWCYSGRLIVLKLLKYKQSYRIQVCLYFVKFLNSYGICSNFVSLCLFLIKCLTYHGYTTWYVLKKRISIAVLSLPVY